jgi:hypothetical protein
MKSLTKAEFIAWLWSENACSEALAWAQKQRRGRDIVEKCERLDWLEWLVRTIGGPLSDDYWAKRKPLDDDYVAKVKPLLKSLLTWERVSKAVRS